MTKKISNKIRVKVLFEAGIMKPKTIAKRTNIPERSVDRYVAALRTGDSLERKPYKRAASKVTPTRVRKIIQKVRSTKRTQSLRSLGRSVDLCHKTVAKVLKNNGFQYKRTNKRLILKPDSKARRLKWARMMKDRVSDWPYVIFTDESSFWLHKSTSSATWATEDDEIQARGPHGPKVHVWGAISARGTVKLEMFEENLTGERYVNILKKKVRLLDRLYPEGYIFQQDNDPKHKSKLAMAYLSQNTPNQLEWPAYSPDLSPIENIWGWLKNQVSRDQPQSTKALKTSITKHWNSITPDFLVNYIESMSKRIEGVINSNGGKISY